MKMVRPQGPSFFAQDAIVEERGWVSSLEKFKWREVAEVERVARVAALG